MKDRIRVFISYSRSDTDDISRITGEIKGENLEILLDVEDILPGEDWKKRLERMIERSDIVVFMLSPDSLRSEYCQWEVEYADLRGKRLVPIVIKDANNETIPDLLQQKNYLFIRNETERDANIHLLVDTLKVDVRWFRYQTNLLERSIAWNDAKRPADDLLGGQRLKEASDHLLYPPKDAPRPTALLGEFVQASLAQEKSDLEARLAVEKGEREKEKQRRLEAESRDLAFQSRNLAATFPDEAALLAAEAYQKLPTPAARTALLIRAFSQPRLLGYLRPIGRFTPMGARSPMFGSMDFLLDGKAIAFTEMIERRLVIVRRTHLGATEAVFSVGDDSDITTLHVFDERTVIVGLDNKDLLFLEWDESRATLSLVNRWRLQQPALRVASDRHDTILVVSRSCLSTHDIASGKVINSREVALKSPILPVGHLSNKSTFVLPQPDSYILVEINLKEITKIDITPLGLDTNSNRSLGIKDSKYVTIFDLNTLKYIHQYEIKSDYTKLFLDNNDTFVEYIADPMSSEFIIRDKNKLQFKDLEEFVLGNLMTPLLNIVEEPCHGWFVEEMVCAPSSARDIALVSTARDGSVALWSRKSYQELATLLSGPENWSGLERFAFSPDGRKVVGYGSAGVAQWDLDSMSAIANSEQDTLVVSCVNERWLALTDDFRIVDITAGSSQVSGTLEPLNSVYPAGDKWAGIRNGELVVVDPLTGSNVQSISIGNVNDEIFYGNRTDGLLAIDLMASGAACIAIEGGRVAIVHPERETSYIDPYTDEVTQMKASADARHIVISGHETVECWNLETLERLWVYTSGSNLGAPWYFTFDIDFNFVVARSVMHAEIVIFDASDGTMLNILHGLVERGNGWLLEFSPNGRLLAIDHGKHGIVTLSFDTKDWLRRIERLTDRELR